MGWRSSKEEMIEWSDNEMIHRVKIQWNPVEKREGDLSSSLILFQITNSFISLLIPSFGWITEEEGIAGTEKREKVV
jgi:hypothetical protein